MLDLNQFLRDKTLLNVQEQSLGMGISQIDLPFNKFAFAQFAQLDLESYWDNFQRFFAIAALFQSANFLIPKPPSLSG